MIVMHHIVSDGWSMGVFGRELAVLYEAFAAGRPSPLPELPVQYADFAVWQRRVAGGGGAGGAVGVLAASVGGVGRRWSCRRIGRGRRCRRIAGRRSRFAVPAELVEAVGGRWRGSEGATLFMVLLAAFEVLLARYSGQDDVVVGSPIAGRNRAEMEGLIGFFVNTLVLRADLSGDPSFGSCWGGCGRWRLGAYAHQDLPFEKLVEELAPERDLAGIRCFRWFRAPERGRCSGRR